MVDRAREYLEKMDIRDTQYLIVQHQDRQHPHIHFIFNRIDYQGKTISDRFQKQRNARMCKDLTVKHGHYLAPGKDLVNRQALKGADKARYDLYDSIIAAVKQASNWNELSTTLQRQGIITHLKLKGGTVEVQGVSFSKGQIHLKVSQIDRGLSYGNITRRLNFNRQLGIHTNQPTALYPLALANRIALPSDNRAGQAAESNLAKCTNTASENIINPLPAHDLGEDFNMAYRKKRRRNKRRYL